MGVTDKFASHLVDGVKDKLDKGAGELLAIRASGRLAELACSWVKVPVEMIMIESLS